MTPKQIGDIKIYEFDNLSKFPQIKQFVSTRLGGVSKSPFDSLNLSYSSLEFADDSQNVLENRKRLANAVEIPLENFIFQYQTHSANVAVVTEQQKGAGVLNRESSIQDTDSMVTNEKGLCLCVFAADCVPILFYDPVKQAIGVAHAGWKGTQALIVQNTVFRMIEEFGTHPKDVIVGIGPSIGPESYEVDTPVVEKFKEANLEDFIKMKSETHGMLDLWEANRDSLLGAGILDKNIEIARIDTFTNTNEFFSDRKQRPTGRFVAGIMLT